VLAVISARDSADLGRPECTLADLRDEWRGTDFDLAADALVAETEDGLIVGYAVIGPPGTRVAVSPKHEGRGIGATLLSWAEHRTRERGRAQHRQWVAANNSRARALLLSAGYERSRSYWRLSRELDALGEPEPLPPGSRVRPVDVAGDTEALYALNNACFADNLDYSPESLVAFREEHLQPHDFEAGLSAVAQTGDVPVGFLLARRWQMENAGFVDLLGVHPQVRRRGLGRALLTAAFSRFAAAGLRTAQLGVASDNQRAISLYERCGMTPLFSIDTYERWESARSD
jgi:mycothiol synthase